MKLEITYQKTTGYWKWANLQEMKDNMIQFSSSLLQDYIIKTLVETIS